ncbi:MAG: antitoxin [Actinomycetota bacterium]
MRTTVDLDPDLHAEAMERAKRSRTTLSAIVNEALERSLRPIDPLRRDPMTGLGVVDLGRSISGDEVTELLDE